MKNFLSLVTRICTEIAETTSNVTQAAWPSRHASSVAPVVKNRPGNAADTQANGSSPRPSRLERQPVSETSETSPEYGIENRDAPEFDVASFCSELDAWRASLRSQRTRSAESEHQSSAKQESPAASSRTALLPRGPNNSSASLESDVAQAVRRIDHGQLFRSLAHLSHA